MSGPLSGKLAPKNHHLLQVLSLPCLHLELPLADFEAAIPLTHFPQGFPKALAPGIQLLVSPPLPQTS